MTSSNSSTRNSVVRAHWHSALLCCGIYLVCLLISWPFAQMGFIDDFSYIKTAQVFAQTGHLVYNGWATAMLGWQIPWTALFIKLFGFSFNVAKLSTVPIAVATIVVFHATLIRFGVTVRNAVIGTLTLALSPLFLPLSVSYMSDIYGLLVIVFCFYCCKRAVDSHSPRATVLWLCLAAASNIVGGTTRQIAWLGLLVMLPSTGWLLRRRRMVLPITLALWGAGAGCIYVCMHWFSLQPYSLHDTLLPDFDRFSGVLGAMVLATADRFLATLLCLSLAIFPVLAVWCPRPYKNIFTPMILAVAIILPMTIVQVLAGPSMDLWLPNVLATEFSTNRQTGLGANEAAHLFTLPLPIQVVIALLAAIAAICCLSAVRSWRQSGGRLRDNTDAHAIAWLLGPYTAAYFLLLIQRVWVTTIFDRYMLGIMPFAILCVILFYQVRVGSQLPRSSVVLLVVCASLAVAGTHDWFAWQRARLTAIAELRAAGVPRTSFYAGMEYDGWTQIETAGYTNDHRIVNPPGAYKAPLADDPCIYAFGTNTTAIHPLYTVGFESESCLAPSSFPPVDYTSWLPPFHRIVAIQRMRSQSPK